MKTWASFILSDSSGVVYECRNRDHKCRIEFSKGKLTRWFPGNPIALDDAINAVNEVLLARHEEYLDWCAKNGVSNVMPFEPYSA